jgi:hypothetical protein
MDRNKDTKEIVSGLLAGGVLRRECLEGRLGFEESVINPKYMGMGHTHGFCAEGGDGGLVLRFAGTPLHR